MTADVQRELAEALRDKLVKTVGSQMPPGHVWNLDKVTDELLPLIADAEKRAAAAGYERGRRETAEYLNRVWQEAHGAAVRAAALDPAGAAEVAGR